MTIGLGILGLLLAHETVSRKCVKDATCSARARANQCQVRNSASSADVQGRLLPPPLHSPGRWLLRMEGNQGAESEAALRHGHEGGQAVRHRRPVGELEGPNVG